MGMLGWVAPVRPDVRSYPVWILSRKVWMLGWVAPVRPDVRSYPVWILSRKVWMLGWVAPVRPDVRSYPVWILSRKVWMLGWVAPVRPDVRSYPVWISESEGVDAGLGSAGAEDGSPIVLAATDPAQPYGAVLPWPESSGRPVRAVGAYVVIHDGVCVAELERGGRALVTFPAAHHSDAWIPALQDLVISGRLLAIEIAKVDGVAVRETPWAARVQSAGFSPATEA